MAWISDVLYPGEARPSRPTGYAAVAQQSSGVSDLGIVLPLTALIVLITLTLRAVHLDRVFDIYYDEIVYTSAARSTIQTLHPSANGLPLLIHPPLFFFIEGAVLSPFFSRLDPVHLVLASRYLNVFLSALTAGLLVLLGRRIAGWPAGLLAGVLFALDPFVIKMNSRNLLETSGALWIVAGYALLLYAPSRPYSLPRLLGIGCAFGAALLTKEETAFHTLLPLVVCFAFNWYVPRRAVLVLIATTCAVYGLYLLYMAATGQLGAMLEQKFSGVARFVGTMQTSGFNQPGGPSFIAAVIRNLGQLGTTYSLLALGLLALVVLALSGGAARLLALWLGCAYALQLYSIKFGTNEEQYYYYLVVPAILAVACAAVVLVRWSRSRTPRTAWPLAAVLLLCTIFIGWSGSVWVERQTTPDNGYQRLFSYLDRTVPRTSRIAATDLTAAELLPEYRRPTIYSADVADFARQRVQYVIVSSVLIDHGYALAGPPIYAWLQHHARVVFSFDDPSYGSLALYQLQSKV